MTYRFVRLMKMEWNMVVEVCSTAAYYFTLLVSQLLLLSFSRNSRALADMALGVLVLFSLSFHIADPRNSSRYDVEANFGSIWRKVWITPPTKEEVVTICSHAAGPRVPQRAIHALLETCR